MVHDWPEAQARRILENIRAAAAPSSRLVLFEMLIPYACEDPERKFVDSAPVPAPLIAADGPGMVRFLTFVDMQVCPSLLCLVSRT